MSELKNEITKTLEKHPDVLAKIKAAIFKFAEQVAPVADPIVVAPIALAVSTAKLKDGTNVSYEGELNVGSVLNVVAEDGTATVAPDGMHELEDGTKVTIANGIISEVTKVEPIEPATTETETLLTQMQQAFKAMELKLSAQVTEKESLKAELLEVKEALKTTLLAFKTIIEAPVVESGVVNKQDFEKMSPLDKRRYYKSQMK